MVEYGRLLVVFTRGAARADAHATNGSVDLTRYDGHQVQAAFSQVVWSPKVTAGGEWSRFARGDLTQEHDSMRKSRFTKEQSAYALRQPDSGAAVADVCRQLGVSEATFCVWK